MRLAAASVRLLDQLQESALEALEIKVKVEDLIDGDRFCRHDRLDLALGDHLLDLLGPPPSHPHHDHTPHLPLAARDLQVEALLLMAEDLDFAPFEAASADWAVVEPGSVADELDDAHREAHITLPPLALSFYTGAAGGSDHCRVNRARGEHHAVA